MDGGEDAARKARERFGRRVAEARKLRRGLTQLQFVDELGIDTSHLSRIERGTVDPSDILRVRIANALGTTVAWLSRDGDDIHETQRTNASDAKLEVIESDDFKRAPDAVKEWFLGLSRHESGDLSVLQWGAVLQKGRELFDLGVLDPRHVRDGRTATVTSGKQRGGLPKKR